MPLTDPSPTCMRASLFPSSHLQPLWVWGRADPVAVASGIQRHTHATRRLGAQGPPTILPRPFVSPGSRVGGGLKPWGGPKIANLAQPGGLSGAAPSGAGGLGVQSAAPPRFAPRETWGVPGSIATAGTGGVGGRVLSQATRPCRTCPGLTVAAVVQSVGSVVATQGETPGAPPRAAWLAHHPLPDQKVSPDGRAQPLSARLSQPQPAPPGAC